MMEKRDRVSSNPEYFPGITTECVSLSLEWLYDASPVIEGAKISTASQWGLRSNYSW